jgi:4-amino-4-deoxy-L-arabinose transferase-like glycosyltransferase
MARRLFGYTAGVFAGIAAAFFPSTFLWSLTGLKDTMFVFAVALLLWLLTLLLTTGRWPLMLPILAAFALVGGVRTHVQAMFTLLIPVAVLLQSRARLPQKWALSVVLLAGCLGLLWVSGGVQWFGFGVQVNQLNRTRYCMGAGAESAYVTSAAEAAEECAALGDPDAEQAEEMVGRSLQEMAAWLPTGLTYALAAPFPWTADRAIELATIPEMLMWYAAVSLALVAVARTWRSWQQYAHLIGYIGGMVLLLSLFQGNEGTLVRHRGMIIPFVLIFSGAGAAWLWTRWTARRDHSVNISASSNARSQLQASK